MDVLRIPTQLPLCERHKRDAARNLVGGWHTTWKIEKCPAVLFNSTNGCSFPGRAVVHIKCRCATSPEDIGAIEGVRVVIMHKAGDRLDAELYLVLPTRGNDVVIHFEIPFSVIQVSGWCATLVK